ncbi:MAG: TIM-barrel domain-containing protein [Planctomycetota bacterium]|jgi:alpha-D-xyloside xylohydrolase
MSHCSPYDTFPKSNLSRPRSRLLEEIDVMRTGVTALKEHSSDKHSITFDAATIETIRGGTASDQDMFDLVEGKSGPGMTVKIEAVRAGIFRLRFGFGEAEYKTLPELEYPMLVEDFADPVNMDIERSEEKVILKTAEGNLSVSLKEWELSLTGKDGRERVKVGGCEQNNFGKWDSQSLGFIKGQRDDIDKSMAVECLSLDPDEGIYGFGEDFMGLNKNGHTIDLYHEDACGTMTPRAYKNVPFYASTNGYGLFVNMPARMTFWVGSRITSNIQMSIEDNYLDYFLIVGDSLKEITGRYTELTGKSPVPPRWSFGLWMSKISYKSEEEVMAVAENLRKKKIPADVIHLDTHWFENDWVCDLEFSKERFPDPEAMMKKLKSMGFRISLWQQPYIRQTSKMFKEGIDGNYFLKNALGVLTSSPLRGVIDYTNPEAVKWQMDKFRKLFKMGAAAIKTDFGEAAPDDGIYCDGTPGHRAHNLYPLLYNRAIFETTKECTGEGLVWGRAATAGSQRYPLYWGGDNSTFFSNIEPSLCGGLSLGMCGFSFWSQDIGGFHGMPSTELYIRWMQVGVFGSHARVHGRNDREPYRFGDECENICRKMLDLRSRLMPYIYTQSVESVNAGLPLMRPMILEFENDRNVRDMSNQFMFGTDIMIAPILKEGEVERDVYFPAGTWFNWWNNEKIESAAGVWKTISIPLDEIGIFIREGSIIPLGPLNQYIDENPLTEIEIHLFGNINDCSFTIYDNNQILKCNYSAKNGNISCSDEKIKIIKQKR